MARNIAALELSQIENEIENLQNYYGLQTASESINMPFQPITNQKAAQENQKTLGAKRTDQQKINPKELSNEELEFIIRTGQLPQTQSQKEEQNAYKRKTQQNSTASLHQENTLTSEKDFQMQHQIPNQKENMNPFQTQNQFQPQQQDLAKTNANHPQLFSFLGQEENKMLFSEQSKELNTSEIKHLYSPKQIKRQETSGFPNHSSLPSTQRPSEQYQVRDPSPVTVVQQQQVLQEIKQPLTVQMLQQSNLVELGASTSQYQNPLSDLTKPQNTTMISQTSQSASNAMRALQDRISGLEKENQHYQEQLQMLEVSYKQKAKDLEQRYLTQIEESQNQCFQLKNSMKETESTQQFQYKEQQVHIESIEKTNQELRSTIELLRDENLSLKEQSSKQNSQLTHFQQATKEISQMEKELKQRQENEVVKLEEQVRTLRKENATLKVSEEQLMTQLKQVSPYLLNDMWKAKDSRAIFSEQQRLSSEEALQKLKKEKEHYKKKARLLQEELQQISKATSVDQDYQIKVYNSQKKGKQTATPKHAHHSGLKKLKDLSLDTECLQSKDLHQEHTKASKRLARAQKQGEKSVKKTSHLKSSQKEQSSKKLAKEERAASRRTSSAARHQRPNSVIKGKGLALGRNESRTKLTALRNPKRTSSVSKQGLSQSKRVGSALQSTGKKKEKKNLPQSARTDQQIAIPQSFEGRQKANVADIISINSFESLENTQLTADKKAGNNILVQDRATIEFSGIKPLNAFQGTASELSHQIGMLNSSLATFEQSNVFKKDPQASLAQNSLDLKQVMLPSSQTSTPSYQMDKPFLSVQSEGNYASTQHQQQVSSPACSVQITGEIQILEKEIFDCNLQYKSLLSQHNESQDSAQKSVSSVNLMQQLREVAKKLEDKSERLFELKKEQQRLVIFAQTH